MKARKLTKKNQIKVATVFLLLLSFFPAKILAVSVYVEPMVSQYQTDDVFILEVKANIKDQCVNAVRIDLVFPTEVLEGKYFSEGGSLLQLWPRPIHIDNERGVVSFIGGIPGGHCGSIEDKEVLFGRIAFKVKKVRTITEKDVRILESSRVLLDDGEATPVEFTKIGGRFVISPERRDIPLDAWDEIKTKDKEPPADFFPEIRQEELLFDGKQSLFFSTTDDQSGIDYYELSEQRRVGFFPVERENWRRVESPVVLKDQQLRSIIKIRAVDRAGNKRTKVIHPSPGWQDFVPWIIAGLLLGGLLLWQFKKLEKLKNINHKI